MADVSTKPTETQVPAETSYTIDTFKNFLSSNGVGTINEDILKELKWPLKLSENAQSELLEKIKKANTAAAKKEIAEAFLREKVQFETDALKKQVSALDESVKNFEKNLADPKVFETFVTVYLSEREKMDSQTRLAVLQSMLTVLFAGGYTIQNGKVYKDGREDADRTVSFAKLPKQDITDAINYTAMIDGSSEVAKDPIDRANSYIKQYNQSARSDDKLDIVITKENLADESWRNQKIALISGKTFPKQAEIKKQYILNLLSDKDAVYASYNRVKADADKIQAEKAEIGKKKPAMVSELEQRASAAGVKLPEKYTWDQFFDNPASWIPHFVQNAGGAGTVLALLWGVLEMFGVENKFIMYPLRLMGVVSVAKGIGATEAIRGFIKGEKVDNMFGRTVQDGFGWMKRGINSAINYSKEAYAKGELWVKYSNFYSKDSQTGNNIQLQDMNMDKMYQNFIAGTSSVLGLKHINDKDRPLNGEETTDMRKKLTDLYSDGMAKLAKLHPTMSQADKEKELKKVMEGKTLRDYIVWVTDIPADTPSSSPAAGAANLPGAVPVAAGLGVVPAGTPPEKPKTQEQQITDVLGAGFEQIAGKLAWRKKTTDIEIRVIATGDVKWIVDGNSSTPKSKEDIEVYNKVAKIMEKPEYKKPQNQMITETLGIGFPQVDGFREWRSLDYSIRLDRAGNIHIVIDNKEIQNLSEEQITNYNKVATILGKPPYSRPNPEVITISKLKQGWTSIDFSSEEIATAEFSRILAISTNEELMYVEGNMGGKGGIFRINKASKEKDTVAFYETTTSSSPITSLKTQILKAENEGLFRIVDKNGTGTFDNDDMDFADVENNWGTQLASLGVKLQEPNMIGWFSSGLENAWGKAMKALN